MNKFMLSILIGASLECARDGGAGLNELERNLGIVHRKDHHLLTHSVCQKVVRDLSKMHESKLAASLHVRFLPHCTCSSEVLLGLFSGLQSTQAQLRHNEHTKRQEFAKIALAVVGLYTLPASRTGVGVLQGLSTNNRGRLIRTQHLNRMLGMLTNAKMYSEVKNIFTLMKESTDMAKSSNYKDIEDSEENQKGLPPVWRPTTFTIAELIRAARASDDTELVSSVMHWGLCEAVLLPEGVISDSISFLFAKGDTVKIMELYTALYDAGKVDHWGDRDRLELDLHSYNRGMAFAAIKCAMEEAQDMQEAYSNSKDEEELPDVLTIITGRNEKNRKTASIEEVSREAFVLSTEIQNVLIESFYPPVSSYTVPGNSGRLLVRYSISTEEKETEEWGSK